MRLIIPSIYRCNVPLQRLHIQLQYFHLPYKLFCLLSLSVSTKSLIIRILVVRDCLFPYMGARIIQVIFSQFFLSVALLPDLICFFICCLANFSIFILNFPIYHLHLKLYILLVLPLLLSFLQIQDYTEIAL